MNSATGRRPLLRRCSLSIKKGETLVTTGGGGKTIACSIGQTPGLKGLGNVPRSPDAGRAASCDSYTTFRKASATAPRRQPDLTHRKRRPSDRGRCGVDCGLHGLTEAVVTWPSTYRPGARDRGSSGRRTEAGRCREQGLTAWSA
jgi:hypothetical protein